MARNAGGTYSLPLGPVVTGTTILSTWANTTLNDLAPELTDSLSRSGKGGMQAALGLVDGLLASPGLAFNLELSTGLRRAGAGDIRLVIAGADRLSISTNALFTSTVAAADAGVDFTINSQNTRTNGSLFDVSNNSAVRLRVRPDGTIALSGATVVSDLVANLGLTLKGNKDAADAGTDIVLNSVATRTSGLLLDVQNNGVSKFSVDPTGAVSAVSLTTTTTVTGTTGLVGPSLTALAAGALTLTSKLAAGDTGTDFGFNTVASRTAGVLLDVQNNAVSRFAVKWDRIVATSGAAGPATTVDFLITATNARTAGRLLAVQNASGGAFRLEVYGAGANTYKGEAAATAVDHVFDTATTKTTGNLVEVSNNASLRTYVDPAGFVHSAAAFAGTAGAMPTRVNITSNITCSSDTVAVNVGPGLSTVNGKTYRIRGMFRIWTAAATTGVGLFLKSTGAPATSLVAGSLVAPMSDGGAVARVLYTAFADAPAKTANWGTSSAPGELTDFYAIVTATGSGTLQLVLISEVNTSTVTLGAGSWFEVTED